MATSTVPIAWRGTRPGEWIQNCVLMRCLPPRSCDAQRAWIVFRDQACEAESLLARGGTMQPQLFHVCLARLTRQRTEDLRIFGEVN